MNTTHPEFYIFVLGLCATAVACGSGDSTAENTASTSAASTSTDPTSTAPTSTDPSSTAPTSTDPSSTGSSTTTSSETTATTATEDTGQLGELELTLSQVKQFEFHWPMTVGADYYQLHESPDGLAPFVQVGDDVVGLSTSITVPLYARMNARYLLRACDDMGCTDSAAVDVAGSLVDAIGYFKATNTGAVDYFGISVALSADGRTLAVGAKYEDSGASGIDGDQTDDTAKDAGAVYVYGRDEMNVWTPQAYIKAPNAGAGGNFGSAVALSADGRTLAIGAPGEAGGGAAYVYTRDDLDVWAPRASLKGSNTEAFDYFGGFLALSGTARPWPSRPRVKTATRPASTATRRTTRPWAPGPCTCSWRMGWAPGSSKLM
ncbi:hypothetical protein [Nannocystis sp.]|uniref:hypothetical protein n=1 Tax=Nannocystis sp. TaxID=1962667 RepID=UPI00260000C7|nr:hypothetical protein [Nannocystis sp.]